MYRNSKPLAIVKIPAVILDQRVLTNKYAEMACYVDISTLKFQVAVTAAFNIRRTLLLSNF